MVMLLEKTLKNLLENGNRSRHILYTIGEPHEIFVYNKGLVFQPP